MGSTIRHTHQSNFIMLFLKILIREFLAIDAHPARTVLSFEIAGLDHKVGDDTVEGGGAVSEWGWEWGLVWFLYFWIVIDVDDVKLWKN